MNEYVVSQILPSNEIHLVAGPSGAGKTRWLIPALLRWEKGEDFLGYKSFPVPWVYVAADRSVVSVTRTFGTMGIDSSKIKMIPAWDERMNINQILDAIQKSGAKLAVIESFGSFVEPPANGHQVKSFLNRVHREMCGRGVTVIGVVESPKMKPYERYELPRQRVSGAAAWAHFSETIVLVEPTGDEERTDEKNLFLCPRNAAEAQYTLVMNHEGRYIPLEMVEVESS